MITVRPGSHMYNLLCLLSVSGEFPTGSLEILGNVRTIKAMVHKMEAFRDIRLNFDNAILKTKLFQLSGKGNMRTIRLTKNALAILNEIHPGAFDYYMASFPDNRFTGDKDRIRRNHRVGEAIAVCMMAGIEAAPYKLPKLQKSSIRHVIPEKPCYYIARNFKKIYEAELNKTIFTRVIGLLFYPGNVYAVYNTRDAVMKWSGMGELKARQELSEITRMNTGISEVASALLFGATQDIALKTLVESDKSRRKQARFDRIYYNIHFVPLNQNGIDLLKILTLPNRNERLMSVLFSPEMRPKGHGSIEFDAYWDGKYIFSHLDGDIARLIRLSEALQNQSLHFEVLCFPWQAEFLDSYLGDTVIIRQIPMPAVLKSLGVE